MDLVAVPVRQRLGLPPAVVGRRAAVGVAGRLHETVGDVDPETRSATIEPEPHHSLELVGDVGMLPVDVGLALVEQVEVPLTVRHAGPRRTAEHGLPVVGWQLTVVSATVEEVVAGALVGSGRRGERRSEPEVIPRGVIRDEVDEHANAVRSRVGDEGLCLAGRAEPLVDLAVVGDVVAAVEQRRPVPRVDPDGIDPEPFEVRQPAPHARDVARTVAVAVGERPDVDLVHDGMAPPGARALHDLRRYRTGHGHGSLACKRLH